MPVHNYRPEIDGLRAVAILLVVIYHASFSIGEHTLFPGGYIGVDVFFVISGYLITRILLSDMEKDSFSFTRFYERRARRILPALITVAFTASIFSWHILMPEPLLEYGQSLIATAIFSANIYFQQLDNYTAELIAHRPLLHMWSLGIEEQFYILFPALLLLVYKKFNRQLLPFLAISFCASLLLAEYASKNHSGLNFYLAPSRVWELVGGAFLSCLSLRNKKYSEPYWVRSLPLIGLVMILLFACLADDSLRHPSLYTLPPVIGTMWLIWFNDPGSRVIRLLASRPVVWLGLVSYSFYLWHQPVFSLTRVYLDRTLVNHEKLLLIAASAILAAVTYFLIEKPTRNRRRTSSRVIWFTAALGSLAMIGFGLTIHFGNGFPGRQLSSSMLREVMYGKHAPDAGPLKCKNYEPEKGHCQFSGTATGGFTLLTVGDSHIRTLDAPIIDNLDKLSFVSAFIPLNSGSSLFTFDLDLLIDEGGNATPLGLITYNAKRYQKILDFSNQIIITGGRLPLYLENDRFNNLEGGIEPGDKCYIIKQDQTRYNRKSLGEIALAFQTTIEELLNRGIKVILVYPIPEVGWNVPRQIEKLLREQPYDQTIKILQTQPLTTSYQVFKKRSASAYDVYDTIADHPDLLRIYPENLFCKTDRCTTHNDSHLFYWDDNHLSFYGASMLLENIIEKAVDRWELQ
ncbi:MAG: acyltransferase [Desulfobulbaceae bacterium]|nr:acyltransferase [Desulfobulbaceae bacterium]